MEKYLDFEKVLSHSGSGPWSPPGITGNMTGRIEAGEFGIAASVYEKMAQLMVKNPFLLKNVALVVVDELQEIGDPDRDRGWRSP
jgi:replicative superfamily II helicase